ncbi:glycerol-3-phosphate dehydrogenase/oxidase [Desulfosarcina ovata]|uniref:Glycerol-3-phosphate dehydrogenase n=2 Tax=Desulfosarcina ovata TaxID=83564 RepID=A0A5K8AKL4_9BACT|nr:glycerol-3-phosphate dehydrogenase/oxidase [Desulfosarcina ovata]BBO86322.1 glycerol-3-phosphate dehydrogenase [Desulfosarcina ovata subsp. sediminis]BBO93263.1 glycerol-3-phosphate dehydrogenase [Desulfosarcina ovata subsp. ovata]
MDRNQSLDTLKTYEGYWDMIVIGGGATGLGCALDAVSRGYKTLLVEQHDFAKGTSSRSTKLIHGGVRYLQQGNVSLVLEALHERGLLMQNAPHLVQNQSFIVPNYEWWNGPFYGVGLKVYDLLAGRLGLGPSKWLSKTETLARIPTLEPNRLHGGVIYHDGQFDDARLAVNLAQSIADTGGVPLNYMQVTGLAHSGNMVDGVTLKDTLSGASHEVRGRVVINATGIFTDHILRMDQPGAKPLIVPSQGIHLVLDKRFLKGDTAIMVPQTEDGRVLFAVPWHNRVLVGTTDTPVAEASLEPRPLASEIEFILKHAAQYMVEDPSREDILCVFAGIRPLVGTSDGKKTASISRDHHLEVSPSGLVTIAGGKWTTYRKMAEDTVNQAAQIAGLPESDCPTRKLRIHGWLKNIDPQDPLCAYGSDAVLIRRIIDAQPEMGERLHDRLPYCKAEVVWAVQNEMARTLEDVLARRTRALILDAAASMAMAEAVAGIMADVLGRDAAWIRQQTDGFMALARGYLPD